MPPALVPRDDAPTPESRVAGAGRRSHLVGDATLRMNPLVTEQDLAAVARLVAGDERGLAELYDRHGGMAYSLAAAILRDGPDAEEVVADAFSQVWRTAANFDPGRGSVVAWISTIVRTRALDLIRSQKRRARMLDRAEALADEGSAPGLGTGAELADRGAEQSEAQLLVRRALDALPSPQRVALELAYFGGLSQSEIAARLNEPLGTVKTRMRAGMEKLRGVLGPLLGGAS
jgi:RNA polymerase sigma-70 factor, ECF subfamily